MRPPRPRPRPPARRRRRRGGASSSGLALVLLLALLVRFLFLFLFLFLLLLLLLLLHLGGRSPRLGFDLGLDLVAQVELSGVLVIGAQLVAPAELAKLGGGHVKLMGDPGVGAPLADLSPDLVQLRSERFYVPWERVMLVDTAARSGWRWRTFRGQRLLWPWSEIDRLSLGG